MSRTAASGILTALTLVCPILVEAGVVTGVSVSPPSPAVNQSATVTITGQNPCGAIQVDFGDSTMQTLQTPMPITVAHTWTAVGPKTITAIGQGANCRGNVTTTIDVKQGGLWMAKLCTRVDCSTPLFKLKPTITQLFGFTTPGGTLAVIGKNFGTRPGTVAVSLRTFSGGLLKRNLRVVEWRNTLIGVDWPADITGVRRQEGSLQVTVGGFTSDPRNVTFFPADDFKELPPGDVKLLSCGNDGNVDWCNGHFDPEDDGTYGPILDHSLDGFHWNFPATIGNDTGTDVYQVALKNDWVMYSFSWDVSVDPGQGAASQPSGFQQGPNWSPAVKWAVTPDDILYYEGTITIVGPVGVPHK